MGDILSRSIAIQQQRKSVSQAQSPIMLVPTAHIRRPASTSSFGSRPDKALGDDMDDILVRLQKKVFASRGKEVVSSAFINRSPVSRSSKSIQDTDKALGDDMDDILAISRQKKIDCASESTQQLVTLDKSRFSNSPKRSDSFLPPPSQRSSTMSSDGDSVDQKFSKATADSAKDKGFGDDFENILTLKQSSRTNIVPAYVSTPPANPITCITPVKQKQTALGDDIDGLLSMKKSRSSVPAQVSITIPLIITESTLPQSNSVTSAMPVEQKERALGDNIDDLLAMKKSTAPVPPSGYILPPASATLPRLTPVVAAVQQKALGDNIDDLLYMKKVVASALPPAALLPSATITGSVASCTNSAARRSSKMHDDDTDNFHSKKVLAPVTPQANGHPPATLAVGASSVVASMVPLQETPKALGDDIDDLLSMRKTVKKKGISKHSNSAAPTFQSSLSLIAVDDGESHDLERSAAIAVPYKDTEPPSKIEQQTNEIDIQAYTQKISPTHKTVKDRKPPPAESQHIQNHSSSRSLEGDVDGILSLRSTNSKAARRKRNNYSTHPSESVRMPVPFFSCDKRKKLSLTIFCCSLNDPKCQLLKLNFATCRSWTR